MHARLVRLRLRHSWLALTLLVPVAAAAAGFKTRAGSEAWTDPAGSSGAEHVDLTVVPDYYALEAVKLWQFDHRACSVQIDQTSLNAGGTGTRDAVRICEPKLTQAWKRADVGAGQFVTGIAVCTAKANDAGPAIHGLELWASRLDGDGNLKPAKASARISFADCDKWSQKRVCPNGSVATALRGFRDDAEHGLIGFALRCQTLEATK